MRLEDVNSGITFNYNTCTKMYILIQTIYYYKFLKINRQNVIKGFNEKHYDYPNNYS